VSDLAEVDREQWDALDHGPSPFLEYGFLRALELTGSTGGKSGWYPHYLLAEVIADEDEDEDDDSGADDTGDGGDAPKGDRQEPRSMLVGAVPAFVKAHSYGEYIFDWGWSSAAMRAGIEYYPKIVVAAPVTPATGRRLLVHPDIDRAPVVEGLVAGVRELADVYEASSIHFLFVTEDEQRELSELGFAPRHTYQFHWHNPGYDSFDDFLARMSSRKRKQIRKERRRCHESADPVEFVAGADLDERDLAAIDRFYRRTVWEHGGSDYLRPGFFEELQRQLPERMQFARVTRDDRIIAGAISLETDQGLYGRYWGCDDDIEFLHFETAYYAGIDRCIERKLPLFEAGAQGEHKLLRGFEPSPTYSNHWIRDPGLSRAIESFCRQEAFETRQRMRALADYLPFKKGD